MIPDLPQFSLRFTERKSDVFPMTQVIGQLTPFKVEYRGKVGGENLFAIKAGENYFFEAYSISDDMTSRMKKSELKKYKERVKRDIAFRLVEKIL